jgi:hypothetical protein
MTDSEDICKIWLVKEFIYPENTYIPIIPTRTASGNYYVLTGKNHWIWDHSIEYMIREQKCIVRVEGYYEYKMNNVFEEWVSVFYNKKKHETDNIKKETYKLFLNSLYGKMGEKEHSENIFFTEYADVIEYCKHNPVKTCILMDKRTLLDEGHKCWRIEKVNTNLIPKHTGALCFIASWITSQARLHLCKVMNMILKMKGEVYYCDTDSIFTNIELPEEYVHSQDLGKWKKECEIKRGNFYGNKCYIYETIERKVVRKMKGIPYKAFPKEEECWELENVEFLIATIRETWNRQWGKVKNKENQEKFIRRTYNRRKFFENNSIPFSSLEEAF